MAQDFFTKDVGRAFAFGASHDITAPVETLRDVVDRFPQRAVSRHAALALALLGCEIIACFARGRKIDGFRRKLTGLRVA